MHSTLADIRYGSTPTSQVTRLRAYGGADPGTRHRCHHFYLHARLPGHSSVDTGYPS